ncbi:MAG: DUF1638 domain-containing protein [Methanomassiliicoccales archaeon]
MVSGILGMIGCPILEDEMAYVITSDPEVSEVVFVDTEDASNLIRKVRGSGAKDIRFIQEGDLESFRSDNGLTLLIWMKSAGLHEEPDDLREEVLRSMERMSEACDSLLLFYGLCGNAFRDIDELSSRFRTPVFILRDSKGQVVDDCIATPLGGTEGYLALLRRYAGVFYLTPAWAENWRDMMGKMELFKGVDDVDIGTMKQLFDMADYSKVLKIDTGLGDRETFHRKSREFAEIFDFEEHTLEDGYCSLEVVEDSYSRAKRCLS